MVVTTGVTYTQKISPQAGETCGLILNYNLTLRRPSEETPMETLNVDVGLTYCCESFYAGGGRAFKEIRFITHAPLLQKLLVFQQSHWPKHP